MSSDRKVTPFIARIAVAVGLLLTVNGASATFGPGPSLASVATVSAATLPAESSPTSAVSTDSTAPTDPQMTSTLVAQTTTTQTATYQEGWSTILYSGRWAFTSYSGYSGGRAKSSRQLGAAATFRFTGTGISWIGPTGPTRGKAKIYINGHYVKTVSMYSSRFVARHVIFAANYSIQAKRTLKIVVLGTAGHPTVAIDALLVRRLVTTSTPAPGGKTVNVASIAALKTALADNTVGQIVVANGTYRVSPAGAQASNSLWISSRYASRTNPVLVRAATVGGVTFDGGGTRSFGCIAFESTVHDQIWDGFNCANGWANQTGVIVFGGFPALGSPHHITLRNIKIAASCRGYSTTASSPSGDHAFYLSEAAGTGPNHLRFENITVDGRGGLSSAFHFYHSLAGVPNASDVSVRGLKVIGTQQGLMLWDRTLKNIVFDTVTITGALRFGVRYEALGATGVTFRAVTTTHSGTRGFYSSLGSHPPGVTFSTVSFN